MVSALPSEHEGTSARGDRRTAALLDLARTLSDLVEPHETAELVARWAKDVAHAREAGVYLREDDGSLTRIAIAGLMNPDTVGSFERIPGDTPMPAHTAVATDTVLWFENESDWADYPELMPGLRAIHFPTVGIVPLTIGDQTSGALYANFAPGTVLDDEDKRFLETLGELAAQNLRRATLLDEAMRTNAVLDAMAAAMPIGVAIVDHERRFIVVNEEAARINGVPLSEHSGRTLEDVMPTLSAEVLSYFDQVLAGGEPVVGRELVDPNAPHGPTMRGTTAVRASWFPIRDHDDEVLAAGVVIEDVSTRKTDEYRLALLAELSNLLQDTLSREAVSDRLADVLVPRLGHLGVVLHVDGSAMSMGAIRCSTEELQGRVGTALAAMPELLEMSGLLKKVTDEAEPVLLADYQVGGPSHGRLNEVRAITELQMGSLMVLPMRTRDVTHGILILGRTEGSTPYNEDDVAFASIVARRGGMALDNATLYARLDEMAVAERERGDRFAALEAAHRQIARTLQATLIPHSLPTVPGTETAARYLPIGVGVDAGGDTYDLFETDDGWIAVMADVCGKGPEAAAVTSLVRHAVRSRSLYDSDPAQLLDHVNDVLRRHHDGPDVRFVTAQIARLVTVDGGVEVSLASAGHPPPVLVRGTDVSLVESSGRLLGLFDTTGAQSVTLTLAKDDTLVFYTDGVTEARDASGALFDESGLLDSVRSAARRGMSPASMLGHVERTVRTHAGDNLRDDLALLAVTATDTGTGTG